MKHIDTSRRKRGISGQQGQQQQSHRQMSTTHTKTSPKCRKVSPPREPLLRRLSLVKDINLQSIYLCVQIQIRDKRQESEQMQGQSSKLPNQAIRIVS